MNPTSMSEDGVARLPTPFIVGMSRSGTTLLRLMLDAHPSIAIPAESHFYPAFLAVDPKREDWFDASIAAITGSHVWGDYRMDADAFVRDARAANPAGKGDILRAFYRAYASRFDKPAWGDKWPGNVVHMHAILRLLPEARFVHIIRDGRDVAASLRDLWFRPGDTYADCIALWAQRVRCAREQAAIGLPYLEIRYEQLVREPRATLERVCDFIGYAYDESMLTYPQRAEMRLGEVDDWNFSGRFVSRETLLDVHSNTHHAPNENRIGRWRSVMTPDDVAACERVAGDLLAELGYL